MGDGWSIAWRVLDAQFWGVPQRRRRIALVADFGGQSAPEILFVRKSVSGHTDEGKPQRKEASDHATGGIGADDRLGADQYNAVILGDTVSTLGVNCGMSHGRQCVLEPQTAYTLKIRSGCEGGGKGALVQEDLSATLATNNDQYLFQPVKTFSKSRRAHTKTDNETWIESETANTLNIFDVGDARTSEAVVYALDRASFNQGKNAQYDFEISDKGINSPLVAKGPGAVCYSIDQGGGKSACNVTEGQAPTLTCTHGGEPVVCYEQPKIRYIVRRLTPLECERLQGYPDGWTDIGEWTDSNGKKRQTSDAARYKALGNSIALPPWKWVLKRLCACYERDATMASLFDGIGGFPYLWEQLNGKGTCLWASEIEEFPIAVTKVRIGE
jgi:DNA (cytosine-5)-methyltransferase 1